MREFRILSQVSGSIVLSISVLYIISNRLLVTCLFAIITQLTIPGSKSSISPSYDSNDRMDEPKTSLFTLLSYIVCMLVYNGLTPTWSLAVVTFSNWSFLLNSSSIKANSPLMSCSNKAQKCSKSYFMYSRGITQQSRLSTSGSACYSTSYQKLQISPLHIHMSLLPFGMSKVQG